MLNEFLCQTVSIAYGRPRSSGILINDNGKPVSGVFNLGISLKQPMEQNVCGIIFPTEIYFYETMNGFD